MDKNILKRLESMYFRHFISEGNHTVIIATLLILNFLIRVIFLDSRSIAGDEPFSIYHAQMPVADIIRQLSTGNNPPLFEIILHFWIKIFGISAFSVRFLPLVFSMLTILFIFRIGIAFFNIRVAIVSSLLYSFSNYSILFSHETRVYSLFALLTTLSFYAYLKFISPHRGYIYLFIFTLANILLVYSHFLGFFIPLIQCLGCICFSAIRKNYSRWIMGSLVLVFLAYLPYLQILLTRLADYYTKGTWVPPAQLKDLYYMFWRFSNMPLNAILFGCIILFAGWIILKKRFNGINTHYKMLFLWFLFPFIFMFLVSYKLWPINFPIFFDRYLIFINPAFYLTLAIVIEYLFANNKFKVYVNFIVVLLMVVTVKPNVDNNRHVKETVSKIKELRNEGSIVYISPSWFEMNFIYYYNVSVFKDYDPVDIKRNMYIYLAGQQIYPIDNSTQIDTLAVLKAKRIIFLDAASEFSFPNNNILHSLKKKHTISDIYEYPEIFKIYVLEKNK